MYEDTIEEWLDGFITWNEPDGTNVRFTRRDYYKRYFPNGFNYVEIFQQLQRIKQELREKGVIFEYCNEHNKYFNKFKNEKCVECK